ncbi:tripartite tricarboxylate transporter substrate binding protein [Roseococcus sp. SYP-B2431]|uniref:tripartite tricarboxylate transporter substrate binding protein n=1 Tax=Roseococcus sp. SYP-B2431 TaxID=2496640 RepID=UPI00103C7140|nr:tripartite tricarboxylate transporter substrate binding protein [Roseococcus sp. SYP-B2431]TCH98110.1 tripartite tricarboxylate transporter substrate binding protein [Roseococcus sp. SYP-B2431]
MTTRRSLLASAPLLAAAPAAAQPAWPTRPVRLVVPFAPGGPSDVCARILADRLNTGWGQPVVIENRPGAGGNIGADAVAKAAPDGHTLLVPASSIIAAPFLVPTLPFDPMRDLAPVAEVVDYPMVVLAHPSVQASNMQELVALARRSPGEVTYSSAGVGNTSHLAPALFASMAGVEMTHVPYAGAAPSQAAILGGQVSISFNNPLQSVNSIRAGQLKALGVTGKTRWRDLPDVPTIAEQGFPDYEAISWIGLLAPAATPEGVLAKIERDVLALLRDEAVANRLRTAGFEVQPRGRAAYRAVMEADTTLWGGFIQRAGIRTE